MDRYFDEAWRSVTSAINGKLRLSDVLILFDVLEDTLKRKLLSTEYRDFLVEFILECPGIEVDRSQFKSLMERLFECTFENVLRGGLVNRLDRNTYGSEREEFTQAMTMESSKFNSFLASGTAPEKERKLRERIGELESMIQRSQLNESRDERTLGKMKDLLIKYYKALSSLAVYAPDSNVQSPSVNRVMARLRESIDKQDVLIAELKRKVGDSRPDSLLGKLFFFIEPICCRVWRLTKIPLYLLLVLMAINLVLFFFESDEYTGGYAYRDDIYWSD